MVGYILQKLRGKTDDITVYTRSDGAIGITVSLRQKFGEDGPDKSDLLVQALLSSRLTWCWRSDRQYEVAEWSPVKNLPKKRSMTLLTPQSASLLLDDLLEEDVEGQWRGITLFGMDMSNATCPDENALKLYLKQLSETGNGPLKLVMVFIEDDKDTYIFVGQHRDAAVEDILAHLGVRLDAIKHKRKYSELRFARLENLFQVK